MLQATWFQRKPLLIRRNTYTTWKGINRRNSKVQRFVITEGAMIHAYLCCITAIQKQLMGTASQIKELPGKSRNVTDCTHCSNRAIL